MYDRISSILATRPAARCAGTAIGRSREGRTIRVFRFGTGRTRISLLAGCHADEPVGPRLLRHVASFLSQLSDADPLITNYQWWIVPHINPDGDERNRAWYRDSDDRYDLARYLLNVVRERPGADIEFGFPRGEDDAGARPENRAVLDWWLGSDNPFVLHVSLHGMAFAAGPWFLVEPTWLDRCRQLKLRCASRVCELGYQLHDVERQGEKGFFRIQRGFCTRPDSRHMRRYFSDQGDTDTAALFRPSSMETIRALGDDPLTLVAEMPLFITPGVGDILGPPDPVALAWRERIDNWRLRLAREDADEAVRQEAMAAGLRPMAIRDQMDLQLTLIAAGMETVRSVD